MGINSSTNNPHNNRRDLTSRRVSSDRAVNIHSFLKRIRIAFKFFLPSFLLLIFLEIFVRALNLPPYPITNNQYLFRESAITNFEPTPGYEGKRTNLELSSMVYIDKLGLRNKHNGSAEVDSNKIKVLFIGDSMTFAEGVKYEKSFTGLFDNTDKYQSFNAGVSSYSTLHSLARLVEMGKKVNPDIVVYAAYPGNDYIENVSGFNSKVVDGYLGSLSKEEKERKISIEEYKVRGEEIPEELTKESTPSPIREIPDEAVVDAFVYSEKRYLGSLDKLLTNYSELYRFLRFKSLFNPYTREKYIEKGVTKIEKCYLPYSFNIFRYNFPLTEGDQYQWQLAQQLILEMKAYSEQELGAQFVLITIPIKEQVNKNLWDYEVKTGCFDPRLLNMEMPSIALKAFTDTYGIPFADTTKALQEQFDNGKDPYFKLDTHINKYGHKVVYEVITELLDSL